MMSLGLVFVLLCALASVTAAENTRRCPEGFLEHGSSCYWFSRIKGSFAEARSYCQFFGSHLARITSKDEDDFIRSKVNKTENGSPGYWLGGTDLMKEDTFMWEGGSPLSYDKWSPGQPDNNKNNPQTTENCLMLYKEYHYMWNDYPCVRKVNFICERRASTCCCKI
ncbi:perlucin-like [Haliotis asinina]|uniref:perlucin-like n=1 Tax=Haliotis asinina TaxID=109174 RepID=UPI003532616A